MNEAEPLLVPVVSGQWSVRLPLGEAVERSETEEGPLDKSIKNLTFHKTSISKVDPLPTRLRRATLSLAGDGFLSRRRQTLCRIHDISLSKGVSLLSAPRTFPLAGEFPKGGRSFQNNYFDKIKVLGSA